MDYSYKYQNIVFVHALLYIYVLFTVFTKILCLLQCYLIKKKRIMLVFFKTYKLIYLENVRRKLI